MEVTQMLATHSMLVKVFLGFLVGGLLIPFVTSKNPLGFKKVSFIYTMIFQAIATMIAFSGIVAIFTGDLGWATTTILMLVIWTAMMTIEIKKYKVIKVANIKNSHTFKLLKRAFIKISLIQILLVVAMVVLMILKDKGVINI